MDAICYVCNIESSNCRRNFAEIKSQHTQTPVSQFIRKFLGDFESLRNIADDSNCICDECLRQIDEHDWMCQQVIEQETKLRDLLLATETKHLVIKVEPIGMNADTEHDHSEVMAFDSLENNSTVIKTDISESVESSPLENVLDPISTTAKSIAATHQDDKSLKVRYK